MDAETYPQEALIEEEPRYLRRQKPVEIKRRKFGRKAWKTYLRVSLIAVAAAGGAAGVYGVASFLLTSPEMALSRPGQIEIRGTNYASRASVMEVFSADRGRSVLRVPLARRRKQLEAIPWVEQATVRRALPNRIEVEITERTPVAFLREGTDLSLIDAQGVILDRPLEADFHFPVVVGISPAMAREDRAQRMQLFVDFLSQIRQVRPDAGDWVSEVDLSHASDLCATLAGLPVLAGAAAGGATSATAPANPAPESAEAILVHFGAANFRDKFQILLNNLGQWEAAAGRVASVDLRFEREVVVNPESPAAIQEAGGPSGAPGKLARGPRHPSQTAGH